MSVSCVPYIPHIPGVPWVFLVLLWIGSCLFLLVLFGFLLQHAYIITAHFWLFQPACLFVYI